MQFRVPQNIDLEDKVIGPMTLKQFVYVLAGGMLDYVCFLIFDTTLFILLALPITLFFLAMAFAKVQDQPFPKFLQNFIIFLFIPKQRVWNKKAKPVKLVSKKLDDNTEQKFEPKDVKTGEIEKISQILDNRGWKKEEKTAKLGNRLVSQEEAKPELNLK